jgi:Fur family peroxide stress response transcriptional regulator
MDAKQIEEFLRANGIKPSHHRMKVYEYLVANHNHPNVDMIYQDLVKEIPTLSRTTLYNTLDLFLEKGVATLITISEHETRYDADVSTHGHFQCDRCGRIYDIHLDPSQLNFAELNGFQVRESHFYFRGLCHLCLQA